eukprot:6124825-Pyramimonas_sp.AAC.1
MAIANNIFNASTNATNSKDIAKTNASNIEKTNRKTGDALNHNITKQTTVFNTTANRGLTDHKSNSMVHRIRIKTSTTITSIARSNTRFNKMMTGDTTT